MTDYQINFLIVMACIIIFCFMYTVIWLGFSILEQLTKSTKWMEEIDNLDKHFDDSKDGRKYE